MPAQGSSQNRNTQSFSQRLRDEATRQEEQAHALREESERLRQAAFQAIRTTLSAQGITVTDELLEQFYNSMLEEEQRNHGFVSRVEESRSNTNQHAAPAA